MIRSSFYTGVFSFAIVTAAFTMPALSAPHEDAALPVHIESCAIVPPAGTNKSGAQRAWLDVHYRNMRDVAADKVTLRVDNLGHNGTIVDSGTFRRDVLIAHQFQTALHVDAGKQEPAHCTVASVHFVDGTSWHAAE